MDPQYKPLYKSIQDLQYKVHDAMDDHGHPMANVMKNEIRSLMDDIENNKNPRTVESRMQVIERQLHQVRSHPEPLMSYDHADHFHRQFQDMRMDLRKFHNY